MPFDDLWQPDNLPSCTFDLEVDESSKNDINPRVKSGVHCKVDVQQRKSKDSSVNLKIDVHHKAEVKVRKYFVFVIIGKSHSYTGSVQSITHFRNCYCL